MRFWGILPTGGGGSDHTCAPFLARQSAFWGAHTLAADRGYDSNALHH
jgi:hypothetical protein